MARTLKMNYRTSFINRLRRFLDIGNDLTRYRNDREFALDGNEILYVFDSQVFRMFVQPGKWSNSITSFYARDWIDERQPKEWEPLQQQAALISAEFLLSGNLDGSRNQRIYITPWHGIELKNAIENLYDEAAGNLGTKSKQAASEIRKKLKLLIDFEENRLKNITSENHRKEQSKELEAIGELLSTSEISQYKLTKEIASTLVECSITEPLDQLYRLSTDPIRNRIRPLTEQFQIRADDANDVLDDARRWYSAMWRYYESAEFEPEGGALALWNDARSISLVRFISNSKLRPDQRIVYVTPNRVIFDVYRSEFIASEPNSRAFYEPFLLRRTQQFSPIYSLSHDGSKDSKLSSSTYNLFEKVTNALEISLLPFQLAYDDQSDEKIEHRIFRQRGREHFAMSHADHENIQTNLFTRELSDDWIDSHNDLITSLVDEWRSYERASSGKYAKYLIKRVEDDRKLFRPDLQFNLEENYERAVENYLSKLVSEISKAVNKNSATAAVEFINALDQKFGQSPNRGPKTIWNRVDGKFVFDVIADWAELSTTAKVDFQSKIQSSPAQVFSLAAFAAFELERWAEAAEFADLAITNARLTEDTDPYEIAEIEFLAAVTQRFLIGSLWAHLEIGDSQASEQAAESSIEQVVVYYEKAKKVLENQFRKYRRSRGIQRLQLSAIRAASELAALKLFLALTLVVSKFKPRAFPDPQITIANLLDEVDDHHRYCITQENKISDTSLQGLKERLRRQYYLNSAASEMARLISDNLARPRRKIPNKVREFFKEKDIRYLRTLSAMSQVEVCVYAILEDLDKPYALSFLNSALADAQNGFALDRAICRYINENIELISF